MIGKTILHYKILEKLGEGGMGVVYKAEDTKLERTVAIKFLPRQIAGNSEEGERFKIEAKAAAALNHPNIATIHAIEEVDGELFIVMEYIEGRELKSVMDDGQLSIEDAIDYGTQIAEGLQAAHDKGIIHRDIKSSNIMVIPGEAGDRVKIMDFGLARIGSGAQLTKEHTTHGTMAYMSPEQAKGERVDHRADIWSYGVVLYEMVAGKLPFYNEVEQVIFLSILSDEVESIDKVRADVPDSLQRVIHKALQKDRETRYQNFAEILSVLRSSAEFPSRDRAGIAQPTHRSKITPFRLFAAIGLMLAILLAGFFFLRPSAGHSRSSIAVLPFSDMSQQQDQEYFCDGMTEEILTRLAQLGNLRVIARTSVMRYKDNRKSIREIGRELNVEAILEGSVRKDGDQIKITAQLIDAKDESHIWAEQYSRKMTHVFELQEEISKAIAQSMRLELLPERLEVMASQALTSNSVYDLVLQGKFEIEKSQSTHGEEGLEKGLALIEQALSIDSTYAPAYLERSRAFHLRWVIGHYRDRDALNQKFESAKIAMRLDPHSAEAHALLGSSYLSFGEREKAYTALKKALTLSPSNSTALGSAAFLCRNLGLFEQAIDFYKKLIAVDPFRLGSYHLLSSFMVDVNRFDEAKAILKRLENIAPDYDGLFRMKSILAVLEKKYEKADSLLVPLRQRNEAYALQIETYLLAIKGERDSVLARGKDEALLMFLGMHEEAITFLDDKYREREGSSSYLRLAHFPLFAPLKQYPRYLELIAHEKAKYEIVLKKYGDLGENVIN